jgi:hypothetical protein
MHSVLHILGIIGIVLGVVVLVVVALAIDFCSNPDNFR